MKIQFVTLVTLLAVALAPTSSATGSKAGAAKDDIPRTASGRPDLSGTYDIASLTPFERDPKYGDQLMMTKEEAEAIERAAAAGMAFANRRSDPNREAPPAGGDGSEGAAGKVGGYNAFWVDPGTTTFEVDGKFRTSILTDPPNGRMPALSEAGKRRRAASFPYAPENTGDAWWLDRDPGPYDGPESLPEIVRCLHLSVASVPARPVLYNNLKTIVQTDDHVAILVEWMHDTRIIRLGSVGPENAAGPRNTKKEAGKPEHAPPELLSRAGDSIGWWEGDTLVVETTNFLDKPGQRVVELFTRASPDQLLYQFTVEDPDYTAPYSGELPWPQTEDKLFEYACHEGNYSMGNILRGARLLEKETQAKRDAQPQ